MSWIEDRMLAPIREIYGFDKKHKPNEHCNLEKVGDGRLAWVEDEDRFVKRVKQHLEERRNKREIGRALFKPEHKRKEMIKAPTLRKMLIAGWEM